MFLFLVLLFATLSALDAMLFAHAELYITHPSKGSTCHANKPCTVEWLDDGRRPLLTAIGTVRVGLYTGNQQLIQAIPPVDVSKVHSLTFTPKPSAGPDSDKYYISFISTTIKQINSSLPYAAFSPSFRLEGMTGSFTKPDPAATSPLPIPSSLLSSHIPSSTSASISIPGNDILSTVTVGVLSTSSSASPSISIPTSSKSIQAASAQTPNLSSTVSPSSPNSATPQSSQQLSTTYVGLTVTASGSASPSSPSLPLPDPTAAAATTLSGFAISVFSSPIPTPPSTGAVAGSSSNDNGNSNNGAVSASVGYLGSAMAVIVGVTVGIDGVLWM